jgi:hypothetical protein
MDREAVAKFLGVSVKSISQYLTESREGGRYADHPFPKPDGRIGRGPWWNKKRKAEFLKWQEARPGRGVGGGRPSHKPKSA